MKNPSTLFKSLAVLVCLFTLQNKLLAQLSGTKTIGSGGAYGTLTAALAAASTNGVNGPLLLELLPGYTSSSETFPITIPLISGVSSTNTITIRPQSGATGLTITSSNSTATIDLNGAYYVVIDGRPGGSGSKSLTITNSNAAGVAVRWINDACFNVVKYANLCGQNTATTGGVIFFGSTSGTRGNDSNTVDNCDIRDDNGNTPTTSVHALGNTGSTALNNSNNFITNNNIYNFYNPSSSEVNAFKVSGGNTDWVITGNSLYQTATRTPTAAYQMYFFNMNNNAANNHQMNNNWLGGTAPQCGGTPFTVNTSVGFRITGCYLSVGANVPSSFSGNTFANFDITSGTTAYAGIPGVFSGPWLVGGLFVCNNNTFGSMSGTASIKITSQVNGSVVFPIGATGTTSGTISISGNKFGGIEVAGSSPSVSTGLQCISIASAGSSVSYLVDSNIIGNTIADNLICSTPVTSSTAQMVVGIYNASASPNMNIRANIVRNMRNNAVGSGAGISYFTHGIDIGAGGVDTISDNQVYNLVNTALYQNNNSGSAAIIGIRCTPTSSGNYIARNKCYNFIQTNSTGSVSIVGMIFNNMLSNGLVEGNIMHSYSVISSASGSSATGIYHSGGSNRYVNNMIRLGIDSNGNSITATPALQGFYKSAGNFSVLSNTVLINGTGVGTGVTNTFAMNSTVVGSDSIVNNLFINNRSNGSTGGIHYAIGLAGTTGLISDYNDLYAGGTGGGIGLLGVNSASSLSSWRTTASVDANSYNNAVGFVNATGSASQVNLHITGSFNRGASLAAVPFDIDGDKRSSQPEVGADEIPMDIGVVAIDSPTTASFCGQSRNIYIKLKNFGLLTVTSASILVYVNSTYAFTYNWSGTLQSNTTSPSIYIGNYNFTGGNYSMTVASSVPNGIVDNNPSNDFATVAFSATAVVVPVVQATTPLTTVCTGSSVTFKAPFSGGGSAPAFQWLKNNSSVGTNDSSYTTSSLANGDSVWVVITSNAACANPTTATSNKVKMVVSSSIAPSITLSSSNTTVCQTGSVNFTATASSSGLTPHYQWLKNGNPVGTDSTGYRLTSPNNNDVIKCVVSSSLACASKPTDTSSGITVTVNPTLVPVATVTASATTICTGKSDTFVVSTLNGGNNPAFAWRKNAGVSIGVNDDTLITSVLTTGDSIYVVVTSNAVCANPATVTSNKIGVTVSPIVTPTASVTANKTSICTGDSISFRASYSGGGSSPVMEWFRNAALIASGTDSVTLTNLANADTIRFRLTTSALCATQSQVVSNAVVVSVNSSLTPSVSIGSNTNSICAGGAVKFTATATNGGSSPHYVWRKNNIIVGTDSSGFTTNALANNDSIYVVLTSSSPCATKLRDTSSRIVMTVNPVVTPSINVSTPSNTFCAGSQVGFQATISNGGSSPHIQWYRNSSAVGGDSLVYSSKTFQNRDTVYAVLTANAACMTNNPVTSGKTILFQLPDLATSVSVSANVNNVCRGTPVTFTASPVNSGSAPQYQWKVNGNDAAMNTLTYVTDSLNNGDSVWVMMTSSATCANPLISSSQKVGMTIKPSVTPSVSISSSLPQACSGMAVKFTATDLNGGTNPSHRWLKNGVAFGSDSPSYTTVVNYKDVIKCVLFSNVTCASKPRDTATSSMEIRALPQKPVITRSNDTLTSTVAPGYQWMLNNTDLNGATNRQLVVTQNGNYRVTVDSLTCKATSDVFVYSFIGLSEASKVSKLLVYPNPGTGLFMIDLTSVAPEPMQLQVLDMHGKLLLNNPLNIQPASTIAVDLHNYEDGIYLIRLIGEQQLFSGQVIKSE